MTSQFLKNCDVFYGHSLIRVFMLFLVLNQSRSTIMTMGGDDFCQSYKCNITEHFESGCYVPHKTRWDIDCHLYCNLKNCRYQNKNLFNNEFNTIFVTKITYNCKLTGALFILVSSTFRGISFAPPILARRTPQQNLTIWQWSLASFCQSLPLH
jgi:hypothetical protein